MSRTNRKRGRPSVPAKGARSGGSPARDHDSAHRPARSATVAAPFDSAALYSRNWAFISPELQAALDRMVIFAAGVGLSSLVAQLACRTGFKRFILADGDTVELSNLNRQAFTRAQVGRNKARATAEALRALRPDVEAEVLPYYLDEASLADPLARADLVISSLDFDSPALFTLNRMAQAAGKPVLIALNLGWGGATLVFTSESPSLEAFLGVDPAARPSAGEVAGGFLAGVFAGVPGGVPPYLARTYTDFLTNGASWPCEPQLGVAAHLTSAMLVRAAVALVAGEPVRAVPAVNYCDLRMLLEPAPVESARSERSISPVKDEAATDEIQAASDSAGDTSTPVAAAEAAEAAARQTEAVAYERTIRGHQQQVRYPLLLPSSVRLDAGNLVRTMRRSGLVVAAMRHDALSADQRAALGEFRLHQYALCGLYDKAVLARRDLRTDPALDEQAPADVHVLAGTAEGQVLAYACLQTATGAGPHGEPGLARIAGDFRPQFPCERELFGPQVFRSLPSVAAMPLDAIRELTRVLKNQAIPSPLTSVAVVEVIYAVTQVLLHPELGLRLALGCAGTDARRLQSRLHLPILYAPHARVSVTEAPPADEYWIAPTNADGVFWPFAVATDDLRAIQPYLRQLDEALALPPAELRRALVTLLHDTPPAEPRALLEGVGSPLWSPDPFLPVPLSARTNSVE